jgi:hypothetical protein
VLILLRSPRNRPYLHILVFVLLVSWLSLLISATCSMPNSWGVSSSKAMPAGCPEPGNPSPDHKGHASNPVQDCSFKPCLDSQPNSAFSFKIDKPQMPVFVLCLIGLIGYLLYYAPIQRISHAKAPPIGRRILLIYRYCTLLN